MIQLLIIINLQIKKMRITTNLNNNLNKNSCMLEDNLRQ
jgi:hypothetical protein